MNGPILLFDKSAIEQLGVDESVWLDYFFLGNICPTFYAETLADLTKQRSGRKKAVSATTLVQEIATKTPSESVANINFKEIVAQDLLGNPPIKNIIPKNRKSPSLGEEAGFSRTKIWKFDPKIANPKRKWASLYVVYRKENKA